MDRVHIGTMGWSYDFWKGTLYSQNASVDQFLTEYSRHFDTVEVNSTFYRIPLETTVTKWKRQTHENFLFAAKFPRSVTHVKTLPEVKSETERFLRVMSGLGSKLGPLLLQFPITFGQKQTNLLSDFLATLPTNLRYAVEIRNEKLQGSPLHSILNEHNVALVLLDTSSSPSKWEVTSNFAYIRWKGNRKKVKGTIGKTELVRTRDYPLWAERIFELMKSVDEVFGYFSKYYSGNPVDDANHLIENL